MIVVVDGVSRFPSETQSVADFTRDMGVLTYAIGVGNDVTLEELNIIAGDSSRVLTTSSFAALPNIDLQLGDMAVLPYLNCGLYLGNSEWMDGFKGTIRRFSGSTRPAATEPVGTGPAVD
nr:hypothetical protein BaRGS_002150 [Batillaria attramentaria]